MTATAYRLTSEDEQTIRARLAATVADWRSAGGAARPENAAQLGTLTRVGAHAIGCSLYDLRDSEVAWIETTARAALTA